MPGIKYNFLHSVEAIFVGLIKRSVRIDWEGRFTVFEPFLWPTFLGTGTG